MPKSSAKPAGVARWTCLAWDGTGSAVRAVEVSDIAQESGPDRFLWVDVEHPGVDDTRRLGELFGFHPLALEDVLSNRVRPKQETYDGTLFTVMSALEPDRAGGRRVSTVTVSLFLRDRLLVTCHECPLPCVRAALKFLKETASPGSHPPDYAYYLILDGILDEYLTEIEAIEDEMDRIEEEVFHPRRNSDPRRTIFETRGWLSRINRSLLPKEETLRALVHRDFPQISPQTRTLLRDVLDHVLRARDHITALRELITALMEAHLSRLSMHLEESMKLLSIIATLMLPLSFLTGIFGMNFEYLPGLHWRYGFAALVVFMVMLVGLMLWLFRRMRLL